MMRRTLLVAVLWLGGCAWSNSLYHARRLTNAAERAERENRTFEAGGFWGQVVTKADSAYARDPEGMRGAEALWLRGQALARNGDCEQAVGSLERAGILAPSAPWRDALLLNLGRCLDRRGDPRAADVYRPLLQSGDSALQLEARRGAGRALVTAGRWGEALEALEGVPGPAARIERGIALAATGRTDDAVAELEPVIVAGDTTVAWHRILGYLADRDGPDADALLTRLLAFPARTAPLETRWRLAVARGAAVPEAEQLRQLEAAAGMTGSSFAGEARVALAERRLAAVSSPDDLTEVVEGFVRLVEGDPTTMLVLQRYEKFADALLEDADTVRTGAPLGDLAYFHQAEIARDSLRAPALASWFFRRIESEWPASPYVPKVLLARVVLEPDSAEALRRRLAEFGESPYLRFLRGDATPAFRTLEDSLAFYLGDRAAAATTREMRGGRATVFE
jgi:tetratricopeptide (TPR) repeat protein